MSANGIFTPFSVKEAYCSGLIEDDPTSATGPTYGLPVRANVIQKVGFKKSAQQVTLVGDDAVFGIESYTDFMDLIFEHGRTNHELQQLLQGGNHWLEPGESHYALDDDNNPIVKVEARTDKIGKNGGDLWLIFYKVTFGEFNRAQNSREFGPNAWTAKGQLTDSKFPVIKNGVPMLKPLYYKEVERAAGSPLYTVSLGVAPTLTTSVPASGASTVAVDANIVLTMTPALRRASVNMYTVLLENASGDPISCDVTLNDAGTIITMNPQAPLTHAVVYTWTITTAVTDTNGKAVATPITGSFTVVAS